MFRFIEKALAEYEFNVDPPSSVTELVAPYGGTESNLEKIVAFVTNLINFALIFAGSFALIMFLWSLFGYMTSFGKEDKNKAARSGMVWSILGLVIVAAARTIVSIITNFVK